LLAAFQPFLKRKLFQYFAIKNHPGFAGSIFVSSLNFMVDFHDINEGIFNPLLLLILKIYFLISNKVYQEI